MTKYGLYGNIAPTGQVYDPASVTIFDQLFDWGWLTPPYPYNNPYYGSTIKAAGRRDILRCSFWDGAGIYPTYKNWTQLRAGGSTAFNAAVTAMSTQITNCGVANLYGYSMYEEEPADAIGFVTPTQQQIADFIYCVNQLYTLMKAKFPTLPIMQNPHVMDWFTDAQLQSISFDLLEAHCYSGNLSSLQAYLQRGMRISNGKEFFTLLYCGTAASYDPPGDPTYLAQAISVAVAAGVTNIGIYCYRDDKSGSGEQIIFNTYTEVPGTLAWVDPYLHYQAIIAAISSNTQNLVFTPIGNQTVAAGSLLKFLLSATDSPGKTLTYSSDNMPIGASLQTDNYFRWTPTTSQVGTYSNIYFQVSDGTSIVSQDIIITVTSAGLVHGTSHTASFQITISPANQPCQLELWLGPNSTTKSATGGLSLVFNSTGATQQVTSTVTLPAAGVYNIYVDLYLNGTKIKSFVGLSTITVT